MSRLVCNDVVVDNDDDNSTSKPHTTSRRQQQCSAAVRIKNEGGAERGESLSISRNQTVWWKHVSLPFVSCTVLLLCCLEPIKCRISGEYTELTCFACKNKHTKYYNTVKGDCLSLIDSRAQLISSHFISSNCSIDKCSTRKSTKLMISSASVSIYWYNWFHSLGYSLKSNCLSLNNKAANLIMMAQIDSFYYCNLNKVSKCFQKIFF